MIRQAGLRLLASRGPGLSQLWQHAPHDSAALARCFAGQGQGPQLSLFQRSLSTTVRLTLPA